MDIREAQAALLSRDYKLPKFGPDGSFGAETLAALNAFQRDKGLPVTSTKTIDAATAAALALPVAMQQHAPLDRKAFYAALKGGTMFPKGLTSSQVAGMERLLDVWERYFAGDSDFFLAYDLGTSFHETGGTMQPVTERGARSYFDKYEPGTKLGKMLGNTVAGDGFRFRGEGDVQNTGRRNAAFATKRINELFKLGVDLVANPEQRGDPFISAISLFLGNKEGWWTGKDLDDFIDGVPESEAEDLREFRNARAVVNGSDKAEKIAGYGMEFYRAIQKARRAS